MRWFCVAAVLLCTSLSAPQSAAQQGASVVIGTGERGNNYYAAGGAICRMMNTDRPFTCMTTPTGGSIDNIYALDLTDVDFAVVQSDVQRAAYLGAPEFEGSPYRDLRSVATIYREALTVVTRADSGIRRFTDLRGRSVSAGHPNAGSRWTFLAALEASGLGIRDLAAFVPMTTARAAVEICAGRLDALALVTGHPAAVLGWLAESCPIRIVTVDPAIGNAMSRRDRSYTPVVIPAGLYPFLPAAVPTVGTAATIVTLSSTPDDGVDDVLHAIFDDVEAFERQQLVLAPAMPTQDDLTAPLHPAAARFYREYEPIR